MRDSLTRKCFSHRSTTASNLAGLPRACFRWRGGWGVVGSSCRRRPWCRPWSCSTSSARTRPTRSPPSWRAPSPHARARTRARLGGVARLSSARVYARPPLPGADCECLRRPWRAQKEDSSKDQNALHRLFVAGQVRTRGVGQLAAWMEGQLVGSAWRDSFGGALCECGVEVQARSLLPVAACHEQGWFAWCTDGCPAWLGRKGPEK